MIRKQSKKFNDVSSTLYFIVVTSMAFIMSFDTSNATDDKNSASAFTFSYMTSYSTFDTCGDNEAGKWYREAIMAVVESCSLPLEAKENFYKSAAFTSDNALSIYLKAAATKSFPPAQSPEPGLSCPQYLERSDIKDLRNRLAKYKAGKIKLAEVFLNKETNKPFSDISPLCNERMNGVP